jgi:predicted nucleic acid-binding protein
VPAHLDAEVLSALGRLHRAGRLDAAFVTVLLDRLVNAPLERHDLHTLVEGAWVRRHNLRLVDALYAELAFQIEVPLVTADSGLAKAFPSAELISAS